MKRLIILAVVATLMIAGSASAQWGRHAVAQPNATFAFGTGAGGTSTTGPTTTNNNDSCDIGVTPAATLLLPYFEVETVPPTGTGTRGTTTFFTITNTSNIPQIAHVSIWTDWSYPVLDFNIYLTGYDVQPIDLYDVIVNGIIAPGAGAGGTGSTNANSPIGKSNGGSGSVTLSATANPNWVGGTAATAGCTNLIGSLNPAFVGILKAALVTGSGYSTSAFPGCGSTATQIGSLASSHTTTTTAVGYVTVDVTAACNQYLPDEAGYYTSSNGLLYDNTLTGDYEIINKAAGSNYAGGNPLVHIRAIPQGGPANNGAPVATTTQTNLPYTFYSRYINQALAGGVLAPGYMNLDRRQPLPSVWAARYIQGGALNLSTNYRIWREGVTGPLKGSTTLAAGNSFAFPFADCAGMSANSALPIAEIVRFDEHENFLTSAPGGCPNSPCGVSPIVSLPETSSFSVSNSSIYPQGTFTSGDVGGWMYLNLNTAAATLNAPGAVNTILHPNMVRASQNWVVVSMSGAGSTAGQYSVDFDATWLGNGCTGAVGLSTAYGGAGFIGPAPVVTP